MIRTEFCLFLFDVHYSLFCSGFPDISNQSSLLSEENKPLIVLFWPPP